MYFIFNLCIVYCIESDLSISHILILPPHPNHIPDMTPTDAGFTFEEFIKGDPEGEAADADPLLAGIGDDLFVVNNYYMAYMYTFMLHLNTCTCICNLHALALCQYIDFD